MSRRSIYFVIFKDFRVTIDAKYRRKYRKRQYGIPCQGHKAQKIYKKLLKQFDDTHVINENLYFKLKYVIRFV